MTFATDTAIAAGEQRTPPTRRGPPNIHEDAYLDRIETAAALTEAGYRTSPATLATKATRGGGPPYQLYGRKPLYRWGDALEWAKARLSRPVTNTSEARTA
jgi:alkylation response protein AidB-like acyl-CoA dehydrogenase